MLICNYFKVVISMNRRVFTNTKMINQTHLYQNKKTIALVPKTFNWQKNSKPTIFSSWFKVADGALRAHRRFAAITGSKFCIESYLLMASSQHFGAIAAVTILLFNFLLFDQ